MIKAGKFDPVTLVRTVVIFLAVSRLTRLLLDDKIAEPIRGKLESSSSENLQYLASCPMCTSMWVGLLVAVLPVPKRLLVALAASEAAILVRVVEARLEQNQTVWGS